MPGSILSLPNVAGATFRADANLVLGVLQSKGGAFNLSLAYSVGSSALTIAAKQEGGSDASASSPIVAGMRSATAGSGDFNVRSLAAAASLVVSSGSTLGHGNSDSRWTYVYLIDNAGTLELAVSSKFFGLQGIASTTAEGGAGAADSATTMYSTTARSNVPYLCVGRFQAPQATGGTWGAVPTSAQVLPFEAARGSDLLMDTDGIYDIGASGASRPRDLFLSRNAAFGGTVTKPGQPCCLVQVGSAQNNVTGDGTLFDIALDTEIFDQANNFSGGTFTAPVTGRYALSFSTHLSNMGAGHNVRYIKLISSNRTYLHDEEHGAGANPFTAKTLELSVIADMDAGDTVYPEICVSGSTKTVTVAGGSPNTFLSIELVA